MQIQKIIMPNVFQQEALKKLEETQEKRGVVVMPTGTGKTFLAVLWFKRILEKDKNAKLLFICHNQDILSQANEKEFQKGLEDFEIDYGYYNANEKDIKQVTFATTQTLTRGLNKFDKDFFDYVIVDESHHYRAKSFKRVVEYFNPKFLLGLTATPNRTDNKSIFKVLGKKIYEEKVSTAIKKGLLTKINYWCVDNDIDFTDVKWNGNNYDKKDLNKKICVTEYDEAILKEYQETLKNKFGKNKTICFCATVEHTYRMESLFNERGFKSIALCGKHYKYKKRSSTTRLQRNKVVEGFKNGNYDIIFVRDLFNEGVDVPDCDSIMMLRPTQSHTIFTQQIGRGLRKSEGKEDVLILDFTGNARRCVINFEALGEMIELDIVDRVKSEVKERENNEIEFVSLGCKVRLSNVKYNLINGNYPSKEKIKEEYFKLKEIMGKPTQKEFHLQTRYPESTIRKVFGTWNNFLKQIGEPLHINSINHGISKEEVVKEYNRVKQLTGRRPKLIDFCYKDKISNISEKSIRNTFGSFNNLLKYMGEDTTEIIRGKQYSRDNLEKIYGKLKNKLGRPPKLSEIEKELQGSITSYFNSFNSKNWRDMRIKLGDPYTKITKNEIIKEYQRIKRELGKVPTQSEYIKSNPKKGHGINPIGKWFGGYLGLIRAVGDEDFYTKNINTSKINTYRYTKENLKEIYLNLIKETKKSYIGCAFWYSKTRIAQNTIEVRFGSWNNFVAYCGIKPKVHYHRKEDLLLSYNQAKEKIKSIPTTKEFQQITGISHQAFQKFYGGYTDFLKEIGDYPSFETKRKRILNLQGYTNRRLKEKDLKSITLRYLNKESLTKISLDYNIGVATLSKRLKEKGIKIRSPSKQRALDYESKGLKIISEYKPKTIIPIKPKQKGNKNKSYEGLVKSDYSSNTSKEDKIDIRERILSKIKNGDNVLLLESPDLTAIKEIERSGIKPKKIVIPNHLEFNKLAQELRKYKTDLNIECINTSALQYLVDSEERFDFIWLDYCGAFSYYMKDLDILFAKHFGEMKLILTYNLFDPAKEDENYYFTRVIDYVLDKISGKSKVRLINDVTYRYKKNMYNIGFEIKNEGVKE